MGNLNVGCSENNLEFVQIRAKKIGEKAPQIFNVKMFEPKNELCCARLTVAKSDAVLLRSSIFWPRPIYTRPWNFDRNVSSSNEAAATVDCLSATAENQDAHPTNSVPNGPELAAQWRAPVLRVEAEPFIPPPHRTKDSQKLKTTIGHLNVNHPQYKFEDVSKLVKHHKIHILGVTETWLDESISDGEVAITDYRMFRLDRKGKAGGGGVYIHSLLTLSTTPVNHTYGSGNALDWIKTWKKRIYDWLSVSAPKLFCQILVFLGGRLGKLGWILSNFNGRFKRRLLWPTR